MSGESESAGFLGITPTKDRLRNIIMKTEVSHRRFSATFSLLFFFFLFKCIHKADWDAQKQIGKEEKKRA